MHGDCNIELSNDYEGGGLFYQYVQTALLGEGVWNLPDIPDDN